MVKEEGNFYGMVIMFYMYYVGLVKENEREEQGTLGKVFFNLCDLT